MSRIQQSRSHLRSQDGFNLIELMIVVLIIGLLASIVVPIYNGQRAKARDGQRRSDLRSLAGAAASWSASADKSPYANIGGANATSQGWATAQNTTSYLLSTVNFFAGEGMLPAGIRDPSGIGSGGSLPITIQNGYMHYRCTSGGDGAYIWAFFAEMESPSNADIAIRDKWIADGCVTEPVTTWGMNHLRVYQVGTL